jgi:peptidoglycan/LPS O-acetylase OafA/YrhL
MLEWFGPATEAGFAGRRWPSKIAPAQASDQVHRVAAIFHGRVGLYRRRHVGLSFHGLRVAAVSAVVHNGVVPALIRSPIAAALWVIWSARSLRRSSSARSLCMFARSSAPKEGSTPPESSSSADGLPGPTGSLTFRSSPEYAHTFAGRPRIEPLTGLRWFAALLVFFSHFEPSENLPKALQTFFASGYMGVTVFFVLSGFILTVTYADALARPSFKAVWNFEIARFARVYPAYLFVLLYVFAVAASNGQGLTNWLLHTLALQAWSESVYVAYSYIPPGWSIGVEFFLYACFPLLVYLLWPRLTTRRTCVALGVIVTAFMSFVLLYFYLRGYDSLSIADPRSTHRWFYRTPVMRLGDFTLGIASAALYLKSRDRPPGERVAAFAQLFVVVAIVAMMCQPSLLDTAGSWDLIYAVPTAVLLFFLATQPAVGVSAVLAVPIVVALGEASYAFYLIHFPLGEALGIQGIGSVTSFGVYWLRLALLAMLAWGIHVCIERPSRGWLRRRLSLA